MRHVESVCRAAEEGVQVSRGAWWLVVSRCRFAITAKQLAHEPAFLRGPSIAMGNETVGRLVLHCSIEKCLVLERSWTIIRSPVEVGLSMRVLDRHEVTRYITCNLKRRQEMTASRIVDSSYLPCQ